MNSYGCLDYEKSSLCSLVPKCSFSNLFVYPKFQRKVENCRTQTTNFIIGLKKDVSEPEARIKNKNELAQNGDEFFKPSTIFIANFF